MHSIIPKPQTFTLGDGDFILLAEATFQADEWLFETALFFQQELQASTGFGLPLVESGGTILFSLQEGLADEAYTLTVTPGRVVIRASSPKGAFWGTRSLLQLFPSAVLSKETVDGVTWVLPVVTIEDQPRFGWRGSHFDVARHFFSKEFVCRYLDLLALHKLNVLHFHLTEDQAWRMEIKRYPRLTEVGAYRSDTMITYDPATYTGQPHSGFYTQDDLREIVAYAAERHITVVPEIEMPGHATAAIAAYPELGNGTEPIEVGTRWGVYNTILNVEDSTLDFFRNVLDEVMEIFPSPFIHIGGDECPKDEWKASPRAQQRMKDEGLENEHELQSWFIRQMDGYLASKGRRLMGWSEIVEGGLAPGAALMVWLGTEDAVHALQSGHDVVMAQNSHLYFDYSQNLVEDKAAEWMAVSTVENVYSYNPIPEGVSADEAAHVLGIQYQLWTEYIPTEARLEFMAFPRACAAAEVAWTEGVALEIVDFLSRLDQHFGRLDVLGVNYARPVEVS